MHLIYLGWGFFWQGFCTTKKKRFCPQGFSARYENCRGIRSWMGIVFPGQACALSAIWSLYCSTDSNVQGKNVKKVQNSVPSKEQAVGAFVALTEAVGGWGGRWGYGRVLHPGPKQPSRLTALDSSDLPVTLLSYKQPRLNGTTSHALITGVRVNESKPNNTSLERNDDPTPGKPTIHCKFPSHSY